MKKQKKNTGSKAKESKGLVWESEPIDRNEVGSLKERCLDGVWPQERDILFRPERLKYVRKLFQKPGCVFCQAIAGGVGFENLLLYKDEEALVVLNKFPYNTGHLLVLPHRHCGHPLDLSEAEYQRVQQITRVSLYALEDCYQADGLNLGLNLGAAAGAGIPDHMHYHLIPRWSGDANFFPLVAETKVIVETLEETYRRLLPYYQERFEEILESVTKGRSD